MQIESKAGEEDSSSVGSESEVPQSSDSLGEDHDPSVNISASHLFHISHYF